MRGFTGICTFYLLSSNDADMCISYAGKNKFCSRLVVKLLRIFIDRVICIQEVKKVASGLGVSAGCSNQGIEGECFSLFSLLAQILFIGFCFQLRLKKEKILTILQFSAVWSWSLLTNGCNVIKEQHTDTHLQPHVHTHIRPSRARTHPTKP